MELDLVSKHSRKSSHPRTKKIHVVGILLQAFRRKPKIILRVAAVTLKLKALREVKENQC